MLNTVGWVLLGLGVAGLLATVPGMVAALWELWETRDG